MKIKSNIKKNYFVCMNESMGVNLNKNYILKSKKNNDYTYTEHVLLITIIILMASAILALLQTNTSVLLSMMVIFVALLYLLASIIIVLIGYFARKKVNFKNEIVIEKEGISDSSYFGITMTLAWDQIEAVVVRTHTIVILTNTPVYFYFDKNKKKAIIDNIKKYKEDILIIE